MGCYHTLWALLVHLEEDGEDLDERDQQVLAMVKRWTGVEALPDEPEGVEQLRHSWRCRRTACVYHAQHCLHGERSKGV
jgi:hypothetical protein